MLGIRCHEMAVSRDVGPMCDMMWYSVDDEVFVMLG